MTIKDHKNNTFKTIKELCQHYNLPRHTYKYHMERNETSKRTKTIIYARISFNEQRQTNLVTQINGLVNFCLANS